MTAPEPDGQSPDTGQSAAGGHPPAGSEPAAGSQSPTGGRPPADGEPAAGGESTAGGQSTADGQPTAGGQSPVGSPASAAAEGALLQVEHVAKRFGAVTALVDINLHVHRGEVLGLLGDNGAGKSTLLKILCGFQPPDTGRILLDGEEVHLKSVDNARSLGIDVVYQDLALIDELTVYHNMFLKREKVIWPLLNNRAMRKIARERLDAMGIGLKSVDVPVARLSGGQRQAIAVARAVYSDAKVLLLDEPLAAMGAKEAALILDLIRDLKRRGDLSIIIVAHNYGQAIEICDRINLLQHGEITFNKLSKDTSVQELNDIVIEEYRRALLERQRSA